MLVDRKKAAPPQAAPPFRSGGRRQWQPAQYPPGQKTLLFPVWTALRVCTLKASRIIPYNLPGKVHLSSERKSTWNRSFPIL
jgi:hypothetical protein